VKFDNGWVAQLVRARD